MEATNLIEKKRSPFIKIFYICILFVAIFSGIFYLYGYLWQTVGRPVAKSFSRDYYIENKGVACMSEADCADVCGSGLLRQQEACMCLARQCYFIADKGHFSPNAFCSSDADCVLSCYEGPVSKQYFESVNGYERDCAEGCRLGAAGNGEVPLVFCKNHQCRFEDNSTCFISAIP